ncbi:uncharacterized protein LOC131317903 [Rhododendron vialii]|uniref:uncharacterized protein LOC131317903 n=1 Tax=Rhododendron vialii TaxID=182163 RepID=UPI00265DE816|nr:uncharacterized protein LOC131317903 [Rhododendron vialii]
MGNCMERSRQGQEVGRKQGEQENEEKESGFVKEGGFENGGGGIRIKIVLTKEELEWLMFELQKGKNGKKLEDVLGEIEKGRGKIVGWKPSLESIVESREVVEMDR